MVSPVVTECPECATQWSDGRRYCNGEVCDRVSAHRLEERNRAFDAFFREAAVAVFSGKARR